MIGSRFRIKPDFTDGVIDLIPADLGVPEPSLGFREVYDYYITPHGRLKEAGQISIRLGEGEGIYYFGHIGYHINKRYQGQHWALRACRLIQPLLEGAGMTSVVLTTDPDNVPSIRTIERLGSILERTVPVPKAFREKYEISAVKRRYIWRLNGALRIDDLEQ